NKGQTLTKDILFNGYRELRMIWRAMQHQMRLKRYLVAFFTYSMAVQTIMIIATYFGIKELDWGDQNPTTGLIISILLIQLVAIAGAMLTSRLALRIGNIKTLIYLNLFWIAICVYAYFITTPQQFYVAAGSVGLIMGGIQALSRSTYSKMIPEHTLDTASYFSFYDVSEKIGIVIGMSMYGAVAQITGSARNAILFLIVFFIAGVLLLLRVPKQELVRQGAN
ncbi:MAG TPA: MFS transporter, partial [Gillisia sp.]|nr:MFS transporter [Gillisia sp.]